MGMDSSFCTLESLIKTLCRENQVHICIHDVEGVLYASPMRLPADYRMHAAKFCDLAKHTSRGYNLCIRCKTRANHRAVDSGIPFSGYCPYGLYELAWPILMDGAVICIIYIGNLLPDREKALDRLQTTAAITGAPAAALAAELHHAQPAPDLAPYRQMAQVLDSYIRLMLHQMNWRKQKNPQPGCHRKAREAAEYIHANFNRDISLKQLAALYFVNEKYLGRVFQDEMGESMRQYLNRIRLQQAARQLESSRQSVLNIALDCGFQNIPYFHRLFQERYHMTPLQYRKAHSTGEIFSD